jgi:dolichol-phosphate mannosyltransferase
VEQIKTYLVIPTYNEAENLPIITKNLFDLGIPESNVLIVDDNSPDGTGEIAEGLKIKYPGRIEVIHRQGKLGLGTAYIEGFRFCLKDGADRIVQMDADFSHDPSMVGILLDNLDNYDMVLGSRYVEGGSLDRGWSVWRKALSSFGNYYARTILRMPVKDVTGGFRAWRRHTLEGIPLHRVKSQGYAFQVEMGYITYLNGFSIKEIPIYFADRMKGDSKMSLGIQMEAAQRVWSILFEYRDLRKKHAQKNQA